MQHTDSDGLGLPSRDVALDVVGDGAPPPPNFVGLLDVMLRRDAIDPELRRRMQSVRDFVAAPDDQGGPFLSVLLRTQGKRIEPFKDALLSLSAQVDHDFEVVVLAHDVNAAALVDVRRIIERQPESFRTRIRLIEVTGGTRSKPLNAGLDAAGGRYVAVYDDDDLLFAHWVEEFHRAAAAADGRLLRATVANQSVTPETWSDGKSGFRSTSWPAAEHAKEFDQLKHLLVNHSPFMTFAFPRTLFTRYGIRFDEELTVCEDWDVILRGSLTAGVSEIPALTSIYRRWSGAESSYSRHSREEWLKSEQRVIDRIDDAVIMMPPGTMRAIREVVLFNDALDRFRFLFKGNQLRRPIALIWRAMSPFVRFAVRVRNKLRRMLRR